MFDPTRRSFLQQSAIGLATVGVSGLALRCDAQPTQEVRDGADRVLIQMGPAPKETAAPKGELRKVIPQPYGPFYRPGAPFRGKLTLPGEPGTSSYFPVAFGPTIRSARCLASCSTSGMSTCRRSIQMVALIFAIAAGWSHRKRACMNWRAFDRFPIVQILSARRSFGGAPITTSSPFVQVTNHSLPRYTFTETLTRMIRCTGLRTRSPSDSTK